MRSLTTVSALLVLAAAGCGSPVRHFYRSVHGAGASLPIEVSVRHKPDQMVTGTVYYRRSAADTYEAAPMRLRAGQLWAMLPTEDTQPQETLEYYIDVDRAGEFVALGSPGSPYVVRFLDRDGMIIAGLRLAAYASDDRHPVRMVLVARHEPVEEPVAVYRIPGVPGEVRAPMEPDGSGNFQVFIPRHGARVGTWRYAVEVSLNGQLYRLPEHGFRSFVVKPAPPPVTVHVEPHGDEHE